jgi:beta-galactosidase
MHAGLLRPDSAEAPGYNEARQSARDIEAIGELVQAQAVAAIVFDYPSAWAWEIQPQGREFDYFRLVFDFYKGLRRLGVDVDIKSSRDKDFSGYRLVLVPGLFSWPQGLADALAKSGALVVSGPRTGSKTDDFQIPGELPPGLAPEIMDLKIARVESLPGHSPVGLGEGRGSFHFWREFAETGSRASVLLSTIDGQPALVSQGGWRYLCGWPDDEAMAMMMNLWSQEAGIRTSRLPDGLRMRRAGEKTFFFNYGSSLQNLENFASGELLLGSWTMEPSAVAVLGNCELKAHGK